MSMLAELVELVIGVDTHADTHTAALVAVDTRAVLATATVTADPDGYAELVALADAHGGLRAWAMEGSGGYGAGLARHLGERGELVVELDRPERPARRHGAKSDVIDAERAARDALARVRLAAPKTGGRAGQPADAAHRPPRRRGGRQRRPTTAARAGHHRPRTGARPVPGIGWPEHPPDAGHRVAAAPARSRRGGRGVHRPVGAACPGPTGGRVGGRGRRA